MQKGYTEIDKMLPYGELLRGFANQSCISKGDLKRVLRSRGIFFCRNEREEMVPCLSMLLLSPNEFDSLRDLQNTREDNPKKSSSRLDISSTLPLADITPFEIKKEELIVLDSGNYELTKTVSYTLIDNNPNKLLFEIEIERHDLNKSWYESKNVFSASVILERTGSSEIRFIKSYTSPETEDVCNRLQSFVVNHYKTNNHVEPSKNLKKITYDDFSNVDRFIFFWDLTYQINSKSFGFVDILDVEIKPDDTQKLPERIEWMNNKKQLIMKGSDLHNTFFINENEYQKYINIWSVDSRFSFDYRGVKGTCDVTYVFKDFNSSQSNAELEIKIGSITTTETEKIVLQSDKAKLRQVLLELLEENKNQVYKDFEQKKAKSTTAENEVLSS